ncbi:hypothetical protein D9M68_801500 [compost metagenome]
MKRVLHVAIEAAEIRGEEVADAVACVHVVVHRGDGRARTPGHRQVRADKRDNIGANSVGDEGVRSDVIQEGRRQVAPEPELSEWSAEADCGAAREIRHSRTGVDVQRRFQPEVRGQPAAEILGAAKANATGIGA